MAFDLVDLTGHEQVAFCTDRDTGLRAVIALHDTSLGPGLGGTRFHPYPTMEAALADVLRLSRAMSYKNAVAGLDRLIDVSLLRIIPGAVDEDRLCAGVAGRHLHANADPDIARLESAGRKHPRPAAHRNVAEAAAVLVRTVLLSG